MKSKCRQMGKRLMIYWSFSSKDNQRIKEITRQNVTHLMVDDNHKLLKNTATRLSDNGDVMLQLSAHAL